MQLWLTGFAVMGVVGPLFAVGAKFFQKWDTAIQEMRDKRVKLLGEVLGGIKIVKSLGWEPQIKNKLNASRAAELVVIGKFQYLIANFMLLFTLSPMLIKISSIAVFVAQHASELKASKAFYVIMLLDLLSEPMQVVVQRNNPFSLSQ